MTKKTLIPLSIIPSQQSQFVLEGQQCRLWLRQLATGLYMDFSIQGTLILAGCLCVDRVDLLRSRTPLLNGELYFKDLRGKSDPHFAGLKTRFHLFYAV